MIADLQSRIQQLSTRFKEQFGSSPVYVVRAPGRVNLIGEHTDYNEGFVFPAAIDREMLIAGTACVGREVEVFSEEYKTLDRFSLDDLHKNPANPWVNYMRGTLSTLQNAGFHLSGFQAVLCGNVPQGAGLSSSAAYEVAVATFANAAFDLRIEPKDIALLAQKAENEFIGVQCGIMDQFISALGQADSALLIDCRSLEHKAVKTNFSKQGLSIVITNSGVSRGLVDSEYNSRRRECDQGTKLLGQLSRRKLNSLRDIDLDEFNDLQGKLPGRIAKRCRHVVSENQRVKEAVRSLESGDVTRFGQLMNESHVSLRDDFEVSCREIDLLVDLTQAYPHVLGARLTGGGFGGCAVALMRESGIADFRTRVISQYETQTGRSAQVYVCQAVDGAKVEQLIPLGF